MPVYGEGRKKVLVVGEAPGATEDEEGRPFIGKAGTFLRQSLRKIEVNLDRDAWTTNALICRPPKNQTPDAKQISYCRPNLLNAIRTYEPRVILTLGRSALVSVLATHWKSDMGVMDRWVGWEIPLESHWIIPTYHPAYLLRMKNSLMDRLFLNDIKKAFSIVNHAPKLDDLKSRVSILYEDSAIYEALREMDAKGGWVSVDYETNCLKPEWSLAKLHSCAVSNGDQTYSFPWTSKAKIAVGMFLRSKRTRKISSNLKMEERWTLKEFGHGVNGWGWDVMIASHCLDNRPGICSLKFQSFVKMGVPSYNEQIEPYLVSSNGPYNRIHEVDVKMLLLYGGMDALQEYRLAMIQRREMRYED